MVSRGLGREDLWLVTDPSHLGDEDRVRAGTLTQEEAGIGGLRRKGRKLVSGVSICSGKAEVGSWVCPGRWGQAVSEGCLPACLPWPLAQQSLTHCRPQCHPQCQRGWDKAQAPACHCWCLVCRPPPTCTPVAPPHLPGPAQMSPLGGIRAHQHIPGQWLPCWPATMEASL